jgi:hypothetical protein
LVGIVASEKNPAASSNKLSQLLRRLAIWPTLFTAILLLLVFYHPSILNESNDARLFVPISTFAQPDYLPIWNVNPSGGIPIWGNPEDVSRINIIDSALYSILSPIRSIVPDIKFLYLLLNLLVFCGTMYAFARKNNISQLPAAFISLVILFIPQYVVSVLGDAWMNVLALTLMPAILLFMQNLFEKRSLHWFVLAVFFYAWQLLRASEVVSFVTTVLIFAAFLVFAFSKPRNNSIAFILNGALLMAAVFVTAFLAAAYVYAPFFEYLQYAHVKMNLRQNVLVDLPLFFVPSFNGVVIQSTPYVALYSSVVILFFSGFAVLLRRDAATFVWTTLAGFFIAASLLGLSMAAAFAVPFLFILLAGSGLDSLLHCRHEKDAIVMRRLDIYMIMIFSLFAALLALLFANKSLYMQHILKQVPLLTIALQQDYYKQALLETASAFGFIIITFLIIRLFTRHKITGGIFAMIVLLLSLIDLLLVDYKIDIKHNNENQIPLKILSMLQKDDSQFRIFSTLSEPLNDYQSILECGYVPLNVMRDFYAESGFNEPDVAGMRNPFFSKYARLVSRFGEVLEEPIPVQYIDPARLHFDRSMLDMLNVKYVLCNSPIYDPEYRTLSDSGIYIYENMSVLPRAFFVDSVAVLPGRRAIFDAMKAPDFYPKKVFYIEELPPFQVVGDESNTVTFEYYSGRKIILNADVKQPAALLLGDAFYSAGWKAYVDGKSIDIYQANHFLRSIFLQQGQHKVEFRFQPLSFIIGWWISIVVFGLLIVAMIAIGIYSLLLSSSKKRRA